ncbi:Acyltransferase family protein [compost metagenome]
MNQAHHEIADLSLPSSEHRQRPRFSNTSKNALESFDLLLILRGICAIYVVFRHLPFELSSILSTDILDWALRPFGYIPVLIFFCLSGFLITRNFVDGRYDLSSANGCRDYYVNRALRVIPLYYASIVVCLFVYWPAPANRLGEVAMLFPFVGAYKVEGGVIFNHVYWSLPIEIAFFILAPIVYWLTSRLSAAIGTIRLLILITGSYLTYNAYLFLAIPFDHGFIMTRAEWNRLAHHDAFYNFQAFFFGAIAAIHARRARLELSPVSTRLMKVSLVIIMTAMLLRSTYVGDAMFEDGRVDPFTIYLIVPLTGLWFFLFSILYENPLPAKHNSFKRAVLRGAETLGALSYGIYLFHMPMWDFIAESGLSLNVNHRSTLLSLIALALVLLISWATYHAIERPFMKLRRRR